MLRSATEHGRGVAAADARAAFSSKPIGDWFAAFVLSLAWGLGLAVPALWQGHLIGQPYTDLYPAVWGLWAFGQINDGGLTQTLLLGFPDGMPHYYASPIKGLLARPLIPFLGVESVWNLLTIGARIATPLCAFGAARAWGLGKWGALTAATIWGCAPTFQGYAVEGIVEGTDGWTLALWAWAVGRRQHVWASLAMALTIVSSWYLGAVGCLLAAMAGLRDWRCWLSALAGVTLTLPALWMFLGAFPDATPLEPTVRRALGAPLRIPSPGVQSGLNPFALSAYLGWVVGGMWAWSLLRGPRRLALLAIVPAVLSLGAGPWYALPILSMMRFPYRWHLATLAVLSLLIGRRADRQGWWWLAPVVLLEALLLSPVEPILPGAPTSIPSIYAHVDAPLLEIPGPVVLPPGEINPSRPRAQYLLYFQTHHRQPSPWLLDFNGLSTPNLSPALQEIQRIDRLVSGSHWSEEDAVWSPETIEVLSEQGVALIMVQKTELGSRRAQVLHSSLLGSGATIVASDEQRTLFRLPEPRTPQRQGE